jgi:hypothetical protein
VVALTALALPTSWFARPKLAELYSEHQQREALREEIPYQIQNNLDAARSEIIQQRWSDAQISIDKAEIAAACDPTIFADSELSKFKMRIDQAKLDLFQAQEILVRHQTFKPPICSWPSSVGLRKNTIADLSRTADELFAQMEGVEALNVIDQIFILDPDNAHAHDLRVFVWAYLGPASSPTKSP